MDEAAASLIRLRKKTALNPAARNPEPAFMAVVVGVGEHARYDKERGVFTIPLTSLRN